MTNTKKVTDLKKLVSSAHSELKSQRDGFGWAALDLENKFFGERTNEVQLWDSILEGKRCNLPFVEGVEGSNEFGEFKAETRAFMAHGRISTNNKALVNVHPIIRDNWALIHNGVVTDHGTDYDMVTSNDSEHVLKHLQTGGIKELSASLTGYYAFAGFDPEGNLHIGRDRIAELYVCYVDSVESYVYGTTKEIVQSFCQSNSWYTKSIIGKMKDDVYVIHKPDGSFTWEKFTSLGRDAHSVLHSTASLGRQIESETEFSDVQWERWKEQGFLGRENWTRPYAAQNQSLIATSGTTDKVIQLPMPKASQVPVYTRRERNEIRQQMYKSLHNDDKNSLKKFFRYIENTANQFWIFKVSDGTKVSWSDFIQMSPVRQLDFEIIDQVTHDVIDPYNMDKKAVQPIQTVVL